MCKAKPGPRCSSHARNAYDKANQEVKKDPENRALRNKFNIAALEFYTTRDGQKFLATEAEKYEAQGKTGWVDSIRKQAARGQAIRDQQTEALRLVREGKVTIPDGYSVEYSHAHAGWTVSESVKGQNTLFLQRHDSFLQAAKSSTMIAHQRDQKTRSEEVAGGATRTVEELRAVEKAQTDLRNAQPAFTVATQHNGRNQTMATSVRLSKALADDADVYLVKEERAYLSGGSGVRRFYTSPTLLKHGMQYVSVIVND